MQCSGGGRDGSHGVESQARNESIASVDATEGSPSKQDDNPQVGKEQDYNSQKGKRMRNSGPMLPEDILYHIHSLLPLRDAARAACVSHAFLNSWRCRPNLCLSTVTIGLKGIYDKRSSDFTKTVYHILKQHSGIGLKTFQLDMCGCNSIDSRHLDSWLHLALTLGIEGLILANTSMTYNLPLSLLSGKSGNLIRYLHLSFCTFRPTVRLGCFRSLKKLHLSNVIITGDELGHLLPNSVALEKLELAYCREIICLKIPRVLLRLSCLNVASCHNLQVIKSEAPNLSSLCFERLHNHVHISLGEALHVKKLKMLFKAFYYMQLPTTLPNLEALTIGSIDQMPSVPSVHTKFSQVKYLNIGVPRETHGLVYDYLSLASFLDASPVLETFILRIHGHGLFPGGPSHPRQMPEHRHGKLKRAAIICFYPTKSLLELANHVLETAASLECLTLETTYCSCRWRPGSNPAKCYLEAIKRYFEGKVPSASTARLDVGGPCSGVRLDDDTWQGLTVFGGRS